jgi:hypothetical protein
MGAGSPIQPEPSVAPAIRRFQPECATAAPPSGGGHSGPAGRLISSSFAMEAAEAACPCASAVPQKPTLSAVKSRLVRSDDHSISLNH